MLPLLLLLVAGGVDLARVYFMGIETSNGAAQAALFVANNSSNTATPTGPQSFSSAYLEALVSKSYAGSLLSCASIKVTQNQSPSPSGPTSDNSNIYPVSGSFYEYVTVSCLFTPLTPFVPMGITLKATSSNFIYEPATP